MCTQEFRIRHINGVRFAGEFDIFRNLEKWVRRDWGEFEEFVDVLFVLLQLSVWISSRTRLASHRREKCDAEFVKILMYIHPKCEGVAIIVHVFGVEFTLWFG